MVHLSHYIETIRKASEQAGETDRVDFDADVQINQATFESACAAAGGVISAVDAILENQVTHVFCNVRPPGHHATIDRAAGFCIFNNVALGLHYYLLHRPDDKIAVVDWDVHHGDGTSDGRAFKTPVVPFSSSAIFQGIKNDSFFDS